MNGEFWKRVRVDLLASRGLREEQEISVAELAEIGSRIEMTSAEDSGLRLLSVRSRSVHEMRDRLEQAGFTKQGTESTIDKLKVQGYLDDREFARMWAKERFEVKSYGRHRIRGNYT